MAQDALAGHVVQESFAPEPLKFLQPLDIANFSGATPPPGAEKFSLRIGTVTLIGDRSPAPELEAGLKADLENREMNVVDIYARMHRFEQDLAARGYILTRVLMPPQRIIPGGTLNLKITNGFLESVDVSALPEAIRWVVSARLAGLLNRPGLRRNEIERALLIAEDLAGLKLRSTMAPGKQEGGTRLVLDGRFKAVSGSFGEDRGASASVGSWQTTASLALNSPTGHGEQLYFSYLGQPQMLGQNVQGSNTVSVGALVPLGIDGLVISPELVRSVSVPRKQPGVPNTQNDLARASLRLSYPLIREPLETLVATSTVEGINQRVKATDFGVNLFSDAYIVMRTGIDFHAQLAPGFAPSASLKFSQGLGNIGTVFDGPAGAPPTHSGANAKFSKLSATVANSFPAGPVTATASAHAQTAFGAPLYQSEQLNLDGGEGVAALEPGSLAVDEGGVLRLEIERNFPIPGTISTVLTPYAYGAYGLGRINNPTALESTFNSAAGLGLGVKARVWGPTSEDQALNLGFEYGHAWTQGIGAAETYRWNFNLGLNF